MSDRRRRLAGRYELGAVIGRGGMGTVHRATDLVLDRTVAVKLLPPAIAQEDPPSVVRFEREARAAASLRHEGVVAIYDSGQDEATRFIVMECVEGRSLSEVLREDAPLAPSRAALIASRIAGALQAAHAAGIVHRDIKPSNIMLAGDDTVKMLDFGIARSLDATTLTQAALVVGTAAYMAPEQALGERADERSDIYSLGCVLYALLTGSPPFTGETAAAVLSQHVNSDPSPPSHANAAVSPALDAIVLETLAKSPADRPQSAEELRRRLGEPPMQAQATAATARLRGEPVTRRRPRPARAGADGTARTRSLAAGAPRSRGRRRAAAAAAVAGAVLLLALIVGLAAGGGSSHPTASARRTSTGAATASASSRAAGRQAARAPSATASGPAQPPPASSSASAPPSTAAGAAGALAALLAQATQSGALQPQAARSVADGLARAMASYEDGRPAAARQAVGELSNRLAVLQQAGALSPAAAPPLQSALARLASAIAGPTGEATGDGSEVNAPPARHHGDGHGKEGKRDGGGGD